MMVACPGRNCGEIMSLSQVELHRELRCPARIVKCRFCDLCIEARQMDSHYRSKMEKHLLVSLSQSNMFAPAQSNFILTPDARIARLLFVEVHSVMCNWLRTPRNNVTSCLTQTRHIRSWLNSTTTALEKRRRLCSRLTSVLPHSSLAAQLYLARFSAAHETISRAAGKRESCTSHPHLGYVVRLA